MNLDDRQTRMLRRLCTASWSILAFLLGACTPAESEAPATPQCDESGSAEAQIERWVVENARSFGAEDISAFGEVIGDAEVIALGEAAHGMHSYPAVRNQLFQYLVQEKAFAAITLESGIVEASLVERYVQDTEDETGIELDQVLELGFTHNMGPWAETRDLVEWAHEHNRAAAGAGCARVHFVGKDLPREGDTLTVPLAAVRSYLEPISEYTTTPEWAELWTLASKASSVMNTVLDTLEANGKPRYVDPDYLDTITSVGYELLPEEERAELAAGVEALIAHLDAHRSEYVEAASATHVGGTTPADDFEYVLQIAVVARQMIEDLESRIEHPADPLAEAAMAFLGQVYGAIGEPVPEIDPAKLVGFTPEAVADYFQGRVARERHLAENVAWVSARYGKTFNFAHNGHVARASQDTFIDGERVDNGPSEGVFLSEQLGDAYLVIGGTALDFVDEQGRPVESMHGAPIEPLESCEDCIEHPLQAAGEGWFVLDFRAETCRSSAVQTWLDSEQHGRYQFGFEPVTPGATYDAIYWTDTSGPAIPLD